MQEATFYGVVRRMETRYRTLMPPAAPKRQAPPPPHRSTCANLIDIDALYTFFDLYLPCSQSDM